MTTSLASARSSALARGLRGRHQASTSASATGSAAQHFAPWKFGEICDVSTELASRHGIGVAQSAELASRVQQLVDMAGETSIRVKESEFDVDAMGAVGNSYFEQIPGTGPVGVSRNHTPF